MSAVVGHDGINCLSCRPRLKFRQGEKNRLIQIAAAARATGEKYTRDNYGGKEDTIKPLHDIETHIPFD